MHIRKFCGSCYVQYTVHFCLHYFTFMKYAAVYGMRYNLISVMKARASFNACIQSRGQDITRCKQKESKIRSFRRRSTISAVLAYIKPYLCKA